MRKSLAVGLALVLCAACARKPPADVAEAPPDAAPAPDQPPPQKVKPRKQYDPANFAGKTLAQWREQLKDKDPAKCQNAVMAVRALGPAAAAAAPDLLAVTTYVTDVDRAIEAIGPAVVPHVAAALKTAHPARAYEIGRGLAALGDDAAGVVPALVELATTGDEKTKSSARAVLFQLGPVAKPAVGVFRAVLKSRDSYDRLNAARALAAIDPDGFADEVLAVLLGMPERAPDNPLAGQQVREILPKFGAKAAAAIAARLKPGAGRANVDPLLQFGYLAPEHVATVVPQLAALVPAAKEEGWLVASALGQVGPAAKDTAPALLKLSATATPPDRSHILLAAIKMGADPAAVIPLLKDLIPQNPVSGLSMVPLLGAAGKELAPLAAPFLAGTDRPAKQKAAWMRLALDPTDARAAQAELEVHDPDSPGPTSTVNMNSFTYLPKNVAPAFKPHLTHANPKQRLIAAKIVFPRDPTAAAAAKVLVENVFREGKVNLPGANPYAIVEFEVFKCFQAGGKASTPHLAALLKHARREVRAEAAFSLAVLGPDAAGVAGELAAAVEDEWPAVQFAALAALGRIGPPAKPHLGVIRAALDDTDDGVRFAAAQASLALAPEETAAPAAALVALSRSNRQNSLSFRVFPDNSEAANRFSERLPSGAFENAIRDLLFDHDPEAGCRANAFSPRRPLSYK